MRNTVLTEIYAGPAGWVDASTDARQGSADSGGNHTITRVDGDPGRCDFVLSNPDGRWSPRNPLGPYFGQLDRNTPVRVGVQLHADTFDGPAAAGTWGAGWHNVFAGGAIDASQVGLTGGYAFHRVPIAGAYRLTYDETRAYTDCEVRTRFTVAGLADVVGGSLEPANLVMRLQDINTYYMARVEVTTTEAVQVSIHHSTAGVIAAAAVVAAAGVYVGQQWEVAASCVGDRLAVKTWPTGTPEPRDWQLNTTDTRITAPGFAGIRSGVAGGNTNVAPVEFRYTDWRVIDRRAVMEMSEPVPGSNTRGTDAWVSVSASGITRRLSQGAKPLDSALTRRIPSTGPVAWWPLEDGKDATQAASGLAGQPALTAADPSVAGFGGDGPAGAASGLAPRNGAVPALSAPAPQTITGNDFTVSVWLRGSVEDLTKVGFARPFAWYVSGERWEVLLQSGNEDAVSGVVDPNVYRVTLTRATDTGTTGMGPFSVRVLDGAWHLVSFALQQQGADTAGFFYVDRVQQGAQFIPGVTLRAPETITVGHGAAVNLSDYGLSHLQVHNGPFSPDELEAGAGYAGERAADRFGRLCAEQGVAALITRGPDPTQPMGPQRPETLLTLLQECVDVDGGIMGEAREQLALTFITAGALYNREPVPLTYAHLSPPLTPVPDDRNLRNDVTAKRPGGASAQSVRRTGPLGTQRVGVYDTSVTVNVAYDAQLPDAAGWRVHVGTWDEARYPTLRVNLARPVWAADAVLAGRVTALDAGRVLEVSGLPVPLRQPTPPLLQVRGSVEQLGQHGRTFDFSLQPAGPYTVASVDGPQRAAASGSTLAETLTDTGAVMILASTQLNGPWRETPGADFPLAVRVGGERVTVSAITGSVVDAFGRTTSPGWGADDNGTPWTHPGSAAADFSVSAGTGRVAHAAVNTLKGAYIAPGGNRDFALLFDVMTPVVATGNAITVWAVMRGIDTANYYALQLLFGTGGQLTLGSQRRVGGALTANFGGPNVSAGTYAAGQWIRVDAALEGDVLLGRAWRRDTGEPMPDWQRRVVDVPGGFAAGTLCGILSRLEGGNTNALPVTLQIDNVRVSLPQRVTLSARGVNGIQREWPAGTDVQVWQPAVAPL